MTQAKNIFHFKSKASTLAQLSKLLKVGHLCKQVIIPVPDWKNRPDELVADLIERFAPGPLAVRSSSKYEDTLENSYAGVFESLTDVPADADSIIGAINRVITSYGDSSIEQEVLIQPMVKDVVLSGVVLTRCLETGAPYYIINYDDFSKRTDTVTSGGASKTVAVHRGNPGALKSPRLRAIIAAVHDIERIIGSDELDIEFCVTSNIDTYVLQVRPMAAKRNWQIVKDELIDSAIVEIRKALSVQMAPVDGLAGSSTILGEMPDWNPAEMIGNTPRPLALSLYKFLITDHVWSDARTAMGYRTVDKPLLLDYAGRPYIDVRLSLNSFLPAGLNENLAHRLVDYQLGLLSEDKTLHDKIEFCVAITCLDLSMDTRLSQLKKAGFSSHEVAALLSGLRTITNAAIACGAEGLRAQLVSTDKFLDTAVQQNRQPLQSVQALLSAVCRNGTLPFSILARHGFIAMTLLRSMVEEGILDESQKSAFMHSIHTIAANLVHDMDRLANDQLVLSEFLELYGHLRPGSYDILSWRYDERPDLYLNPKRRSRHSPSGAPVTFELEPSQRSVLSKALKRQGLLTSVDALFEYISFAIQAREQAKFAFTRGISDSLVELERWGNTIGLSRSDLSYLSIDCITTLGGDKNVMQEQVQKGREAHRLTRAIRLPHLIIEKDDIDIIRTGIGQPTFVTSVSVAAPGILLKRNQAKSLDQLIVLIESADPGFDWIFLHNILGLITKYGGANSHMAIRCAEFGLPAAIGCGEKLFSELVSKKIIELNCAERKLSTY